ncbi:MAG: hypothetical protein GY765_10725, partial [bacterium]|nr:hypothetical protein [bacterium]
MATSRLTLDLPVSEIDFLKEYARRNKTTISTLVDGWIKGLQEKSVIHPDIKKFTGL